MTRRGDRQRPWTTMDLSLLSALAGHVPVKALAEALGRTEHAVRKAAHRAGISLRPRWHLRWCNSCAAWRSALDEEGECRVCAMRRRLAGREAACDEAYEAMSPAQRAAFDRSGQRRGTRVPPSMPRRSDFPSEEAYVLAVEEWQYRSLLLPYNAAKSRLRRMREVLGTNPRKNRSKCH